MSAEYLFNHSELFSLLYSGNVPEAIHILHEKAKPLKACGLKEIQLFLSSVNLGMYHYILQQEQISLHDSCYNNAKLVQQCSYHNYLSIGEQIITCYGHSKEYLIQKHKNEHIKNAITYIHEHLGEAMTLSSVCHAISINNCYLCELFRKEVNMTFSEYLLSRRIALAKQLLLTTDLSISHIAERCGFKQTSYFCTSFKKVEGITPSAFLKNRF